MSEPVFLVAIAIVAGTLLIIVKTIAGAFAGDRAAKSGLAQIQELCDHCTALLDETQTVLAAQSAQLEELQERLDFAERLLVQPRQAGNLGSGDAGG